MKSEHSPPLRNTHDYSAIGCCDGSESTGCAQDSLSIPISKALKAHSSTMTLKAEDGTIDKHLVVPYSQAVGFNPLGSNTKRSIVVNRSVICALRAGQLTTAVALIICIALLRNTQQIEGWVIGVPPAVVILITSFALVHLVRPVNSSTPASASNYHFFAMCLDVGLIPFFAYIAMLAAVEYALPENDGSRWSSVFVENVASSRVLLALWVLAAIEASMHAITAILCIYLIYIFRKVSQLPDCLNPFLEGQEHRHLVTHSKTSHSETTGSFISLPFSAHSAPPGRLVPVDDRRRSFQPGSSEIDIRYAFRGPGPDKQSLTNGLVGTTRPCRGLRDAEAQSKRTTWASEISLVSATSVYSRPQSIKIPPLPRKSSKRDGLFSKWYLPSSVEPAEHDDTMTPVMEECSNRDSGYSASAFKRGTYQSLPQTLHWDDDPDIAAHRPSPPPKNNEPLLSPLRMNPPTPKASRNFHVEAQELDSAAVGRPRTLSEISGNSVGSITPSKAKFYGGLMDSMHALALPPPTFGEPVKHESKTTSDQWGGSAQQASTKPSQRSLTHHSRPKGSDTSDQAPHCFESSPPPPMDTQADRRGRVVSRTGADIGETSLVHLDDGDEAMLSDWATEERDWLRAAQYGREGLRGRNVSGKVVEEGRAGVGRVRRVPTEPLWSGAADETAFREKMELNVF